MAGAAWCTPGKAASVAAALFALTSSAQAGGTLRVETTCRQRLPSHALRCWTMSERIGRLLAAGNVAEVFEWGSHRVLKLYRLAAAKPTVFREARNHAAVEALGLPVPAIWRVQQINGRWGIVFDRVRGASFAEQMRGDPTALPRYLDTLAQLQARIHVHPAHE